MQCFVCNKEINIGELCKEHSQELKKMLDKNIGVIENPTFAYHCMICGEYEERLIIEHLSSGIYFCNYDIEENWKNKDS